MDFFFTLLHHMKIPLTAPNLYATYRTLSFANFSEGCLYWKQIINNKDVWLEWVALKSSRPEPRGTFSPMSFQSDPKPVATHCHSEIAPGQGQPASLHGGFARGSTTRGSNSVEECRLGLVLTRFVQSDVDICDCGSNGMSDQCHAQHKLWLRAQWLGAPQMWGKIGHFQRHLSYRNKLN